MQVFQLDPAHLAGSDGVRLALRQGQAALIARGEIHSKGSEAGMTALTV